MAGPYFASSMDHSTPKLTFVVAVNDHHTLCSNLLASPALQSPHDHQILVQEGFASASLAYNDALARSVNEIVVFVHQDVFLPDPWLERLHASLRTLCRDDPDWGVLGCWGLRQDGRGYGYLFTSDEGVIGKPLGAPRVVQTLDEVVLVVRRRSGLRFSEDLPQFHLYGTDICMRAISGGLKCYAIEAFCIHNSRKYNSLPREFYQCYWNVKKRWREFLPIQTSCIRMTRFDSHYYARRMRDLCRGTVSGFGRVRATREEDPREVWKQLKERQLI